MLIKSNIATLITSTEDIIQEFPSLTYKKCIQAKNKEIYANKKNNKIDVSRKRKSCKNEKYNEVYKLIGEEKSSINEIYKKSNKSINEINNILIMLEIEGYIEKVAGGYKCITTN